MSEQGFLFSLELSDEAFFEGMVSDVARAVLGAVGCAGDPGDLTRAVGEVVAAAGRHRPCRISFQTHDAELRVAVSCDGRPGWQTAISLHHT